MASAAAQRGAGLGGAAPSAQWIRMCHALETAPGMLQCLGGRVSKAISPKRKIQTLNLTWNPQNSILFEEITGKKHLLDPIFGVFLLYVGVL